ncbi:hypothetical protein K3N28_14480 [Glycomyces sp. TRM65418]|uniref:TolB family protein n=1 Tax=Glycomyces sp. TRM65418 TaxID=2867006 RepID=UPI001CE5DDCB|nr:hypothetical protein [Glycomyces sp. TRM65418]MCC3764268.1 hypothetical protein [Glycomyces sp. TRM65418]QZD53952.1 hypothetical protein K3N28_14405 [Glycomyces sp. TRM65418]
MPDSIRELLQGIAGDESAPSGDLAAGAYRRARRIGRRRFMAAAIGATIGLTFASVTTAALVDPNGVEEAPPATGTTAVELPTGATTAEDVETAPTEEHSEGEGCAPAAWNGWGSSNSMADMDALPKTLYFEVTGFFEVTEETDGPPVIIRSYGDESVAVLQGGPAYVLAPDGDRYAVPNEGVCAGALGTLSGEGTEVLGFSPQPCEPSWSPDSDRIVLNLPDEETDGAYLLDVATGETSGVPAEVDCSPRWSADGEYLVSSDGGVAMRPDGSGRVELEGAGAWTGEEGFVGLSSISADLSRACLEFADDTAAGRAPGPAVRCDRYVDTATGAELAFPVDVEKPQIVFLPEGSMIVCDDRHDAIALTLVDPVGVIRAERTLPRYGSGGTVLRGYFTD